MAAALDLSVRTADVENLGESWMDNHSDNVGAYRYFR